MIKFSSFRAFFWGRSRKDLDLLFMWMLYCFRKTLFLLGHQHGLAVDVTVLSLLARQIEGLSFELMPFHCC